MLSITSCTGFEFPNRSGGDVSNDHVKRVPHNCVHTINSDQEQGKMCVLHSNCDGGQTVDGLFHSMWRFMVPVSRDG